MSPIRLVTLGRLRVEQAGSERVDLPSQPVRCALFLYLALEGGGTREELVNLLWSDRDPERARHSLRQTLYELRRTLGEDWAASRGDRIEVSDRLTVDALDFLAAVEAGQDAEALAVYGGPFLEESAPGVSPAFERWVDGWRSRLARRHRVLCRRLGQSRTADGDRAGALAVALRWAESDPLDDEAQHFLIACLAASGRRSEALRTFERHAARIARELEVEPLDETRALVEEIRSGGNVPAMPGADALARSPDRSSTAPPASGPVPMPSPALAPAPPDGAGSPPSPFPPLSRAPPPQRRWISATVLLAGSVLALGLLLGNRGGDPPPNVSGAGSITGGIAVLPFANVSPDPDQAYFSDGITDDLITALSRLPGLRVISRTSVMRYRDTALTSPEIGAELGVDYLLGGTVRREGDAVRITAHLIDAATDRHRWAESYDRDVTDVFDVQSAIARTIAGALQEHLRPELGHGMASAGTADPAVYDLYLRGRDYLNRPGEGDLRKYPLAIEFFRRAVESDPTYAHGYVGLAQSYRRHVGLPLVPVRRDSTLHFAELAVALAPELPEGLTELGFGRLFGGELDQARAAFERVLVLDPNHADAKEGLARITAIEGRLDEAVRWQARAVAVDPFAPERLILLGGLFLDLGDAEAAGALFERAAELAPDHPDAGYLWAQLHLLEGDTAAADARMEALRGVAGDHPGVHFVLASHFAMRDRLPEAEALLASSPAADAPVVRVFRAVLVRRLGDRDRARELFQAPDRLLASWEAEGLSIPPRGRLARYMIRGEPDAVLGVIRDHWRSGLRWIEDEPSLGVYWLDREPVLWELRDDPRFQALLSEIRAELDRLREAVTDARHVIP